MNPQESGKFSLEDAIALTKFGRFNYLIITLSGLLLACGFLETGCTCMILPIAQCELNLSDEDKGLLGSIGYIGMIFSSHLWGFMADTQGRKKIIVPTLFFAFLFTVSSTLTKSFWVLAVFRFLNGFCICAPQTIVFAYLGEFHSIKHRSRVLMIASMIYGIFAIIIILNGVFFLNQDTLSFYIPYLDINFNAWRMFLIMCSVPSVISAIILIIFIPESPKYTFSQGDEEKTLKILQRIYKLNTGKSIENYEVKSIGKEQEFFKLSRSDSKTIFHFIKTQTLPLFRHPYLKNMLTACYLQLGICVATNGFFTFYPEISNKVSIWMDSHVTETSTICEILDSFHEHSNYSSATLNETEMTCVTKIEPSTLGNITIFLALFSFFGLLTALIVNKVGKLSIMTTVMFSVGIASILLMFIPFPRVSVYLYFVILLAAVSVSVVNASTVELFPTHLRAMAVSISMLTGRIGSVVGSIFVALLIRNFCNYTWLLPAFLSISGGILAFTIPNINKRIKYDIRDVNNVNI